MISSMVEWGAFGSCARKGLLSGEVLAALLLVIALVCKLLGLVVDGADVEEVGFIGPTMFPLGLLIILGGAMGAGIPLGAVGAKDDLTFVGYGGRAGRGAA